MSAILTMAAGLLLLIAAVGLVASLRRAGAVDRMMAAQLLGTGAIGALLLVGVGTRAPGALDLALTLALLAPFAVIGLAMSGGRPGGRPGARPDVHPAGDARDGATPKASTGGPP